MASFADTIHAWCIISSKNDWTQWIAVVMLSFAIIPLSTYYLFKGEVMSLSAAMNPSALLRRDLDLGAVTALNVPTNVPTIVPTGLATAVVSEAASIGQVVASEVTSALAQITSGPYIDISFNVSRASMELGGFSTQVIQQHDNSLTVVLWLSIALQITGLLLTIWLIWCKSKRTEMRYLQLIIQLLLSTAWLLLLMTLFLVLLLCCVTSKLSTDLIKTQIHWKSGLAIAVTLVAMSTLQLVTTCLKSQRSPQRASRLNG